MTSTSCSKSEASLNARVRRAARRIGLRACKSRSQFSVDNLGGFMLIDEHGYIQRGARYDMTAEAVIDYCAG